MARMNIYISDDLKCRMDEAKKDAHNWSAVASRAFEHTLAETIGRKGANNMEHVITRLRASKAAACGPKKDAFYHAGVQWAKDEAEAVELERLEKMTQSPTWPGRLYPEEAIEECPNLIYFEIRPDDFGDNVAAAIFLEAHFGMRHPQPKMLEGFVGGAMEVWAQVKDML